MKLIDNINTLWGDDLRGVLSGGGRLKIAACSFSIFAYEALKSELEGIDTLELLFTEPAFAPESVTDRTPKSQREFHIPKSKIARQLFGSEFEIHLRNQLSQRAIARECADWLRRKASARSNASTAPMQQFACVEQGGQATAYTPIQGFTAVDLGYQRGNAISNFVNRLEGSELSRTYLKLFDQIWADTTKVRDVTEELVSHIEAVYRENSPERIYFLILFHIFHEFLEELEDDVLPNDRTGYQESVIWKKLFNFQKDAATGVINKLERFNGCILADSVGLGKTFTALAVIKYYELRNRSVLVLCPKKLADNWLNFRGNLKTNILAKDRLNYDVLCHTDLQRTSGVSYGMPLNRVNWGNYDLVVIDESHNFRNNVAVRERETRYQRLMNMVIRDGVKTKVLMLSATPVNNRFSDLRNQLALAYEGDSSLWEERIKTHRSVEEIFRSAQGAFNAWSKLPSAERTPQAILSRLDFDFFELLDSVTIARSRKHIETFYDMRDVGQFPKRLLPKSFRCALTDRKDILDFNAIYQHLEALELSIYAPVSFILPSRLRHYEDLYDTTFEGGKGRLRQVDRERSLQALMTTLLLKRLESSVEAFRITLDGMLQAHVDMLDKINAFMRERADSVVHDLTDEMGSLDAEDEDFDFLDSERTKGKVEVRLADMDLPSWKDALENDLVVLELLLENMRKVTPDHDLKLQQLINEMRAKVANPINHGNKKVIIFTAFADTAEYLYAQVAPLLLQDQGLHTGRVTGQGEPKNNLKRGYALQELLTMFSPRSKEKALVMPREQGEIDVLIATDCISEGQNLQDCDYLINYDIHWNPVRIIQRFGRIDRIGSPNGVIQLVNFWPDISLDEYINLKERVENRMVIVDVTATGDDNVLTAQSNDVSYRKEQLRRLQEEVIDLEDLKTGVNITDLGLNDFRMDLLQYVQAHSDLGNAPLGLHAVVSAQPALGLEPGVIFALRNRNAVLTTITENRIHPFYLAYLSEQGEVLVRHTDSKQLLDLLRAGCKGVQDPLVDLCRVFNQATQDGKDMQKYSDLLTTAIREMIHVKEQSDLDSLFRSRETTALVNTIAGLEDFELIAFVVIQSPGT